MRVSRYGPGASKDDIATLMSAVANLGSDAAAVIPDSMKIDFPQATSVTGAGYFFKGLAEWWDK
jgi:phage gp29-like protein